MRNHQLVIRNRVTACLASMTDMSLPHNCQRDGCDDNQTSWTLFRKVDFLLVWPLSFPFPKRHWVLFWVPIWWNVENQPVFICPVLLDFLLKETRLFNNDWKVKLLLHSSSIWLTTMSNSFVVYVAVCQNCTRRLFLLHSTVVVVVLAKEMKRGKLKQSPRGFVAFHCHLVNGSLNLIQLGTRIRPNSVRHFIVSLIRR